MNRLSGRIRALPFLAIGLLSAAPIPGALASSPAPTVLRLKEPKKGSTLTYVDVAPTAPKVHGFPISISQGDQLVFTNSVFESGKRIGELRGVCTATVAVAKITNAAFAQAHFICEGVYTLPGGSLYVNASILKSGIEGVVTGGIGKYAGVAGTFVSKEVNGGTDTMITIAGQ